MGFDWFIWVEHHTMPFSKQKTIIERIIINTYTEMVCRCPFQSWRLYLKGSPFIIVTFKVPGQAEDYTSKFDDDTIPKNNDTGPGNWATTCWYLWKVESKVQKLLIPSYTFKLCLICIIYLLWFCLYSSLVINIMQYLAIYQWFQSQKLPSLFGLFL